MSAPQYRETTEGCECAVLRQLLCDVLKGLNNGSGASPECSLAFLSGIPEEVRLEVSALRVRAALGLAKGEAS